MAVKTIATTIPGSNAQMQALDRQRQLALLLQNQSLQPMEGGRMVGNHFVPSSPMQGVAKLGQALVGNYKLGQADRKQKEMEEQQRQALMTGLKNYNTATQVTPAIEGRPEIQAVPEQGNPYEIFTGGNTHKPAQPYQAPIQPQAAQAPTREQLQQAAMELMSVNHPLAQQFGASRYTEAMKTKDPIKLKDNERLLDPNDPTKTLVDVTEGADKPSSSFGKLLADRDKYPIGSEAYNYFDAKIQKETSHAPASTASVTNINKSETEQSKKRGQFFGDLRNEVDKVAFDAPIQLNNINRMEQLLEGIDTGGLAGAGAKIASLAKSAGITLDENLGAKEAAIALANQMAIGLRKAGTGVMTDKDFEVFLASVPSLSATPKGRAEMMKTMRAKLNRDMEISKMAREYAKNHNGLLDDGFLEQVSEYRAKNPLFAERKSGGLRPEVADRLKAY